MNDLKVTFIQSILHWENISANLEMFSKKIAAIEEATDLILLPEMFSTGFTMNNKALAEKPEGKTTQWMRQQAVIKNAVVCGSLIVEENENYYNRLIWMRPNGSYETYDKRHLFRMAKEETYYTPGAKKLIVDLKGWKVCPLVCYDLRFPVWSRNQFAIDKEQLAIENIPSYNLLIYVANWPERRSHPWKSLLAARAIENLSYVIGLNRVGNDGNTISHSGDSVALNYRGEVIAGTKPGSEETITVSLSYTELQEFRKSFPAWMDADNFGIHL